MPGWLQILIALGAFLVLAPLVAWIGLQFGGKRAKGALAMAALLGFGMVFDPPSKHVIEAQRGDPEEDEAAGDPPEA
ncbi:hypothetical protein QO010_004587 [Caulobacter ginsengisoli]|uniref:Uncharacterized protein n=1 Tax=Caulobacter ginsengisoli TaxID=400775 RepID=A0ABU0IXP8_9CAUL|nr:hypothetical protein [Caulobacter ginsengisoli]MDQ0466791.1 hypothetical protein [Caulobacter ginsengisoli]